MRASLFLLVIILFASPAFSQWVTKTVDNKLDPVYKIAYCRSTNEKALVKLENMDGELVFYITSGYFCDELPTVDMAFVLGNETKRYSITGYKTEDNKTIFLYDNILAEENNGLLTDFKKCSSLILRVNESHCSSEVFTFTMSGSTSAVNFISTP
jgi:hypothetical protein